MQCLWRELINPAIYVIGLFVGILINLLQIGMPFYSFVPFIVPVLVQVFTHAWLSYRNRNNEKLLSISMERDEPSFICDDDGKFLVTSGRPAEYLEREQIDSLSRLFGGNPQAVPSYLADAEMSGRVIELESPVLKRHFAVRSRKSEVGWMIWLLDVTERRQLDKRLEGIDQFRHYVLKDLEKIARDGDIDERTARLILADGWRGVFIALADSEDGRDASALTGQVFRSLGGTQMSSGRIQVGCDTDAPIWHSRRQERIIDARKSDYSTDAEWRAAYPLHPDVRDFLGNPYPVNLINWHEGNYTVIAFDKVDGLTELDKQAFDGMVGTAHTVRSLIDLARTADARFLQSVTGLSAASESSDEMTGRHIHRVNVYARTLSCKIGLDEELCRWLGQISALHDIGKVAMPHIIKKPGRLTEDEYLEMQMHSVVGFQILHQMINSQSDREPRLVIAATIALNHHQNWDGSGYPRLIDKNGGQSMLRSHDRGDYAELRPLKGEEIPKEALIVGLADKYDALRSVRHYKPGYSHENTMEILRQDDRNGKKAEETFGLEVWNAFLPIAGRFDEIYENMRDE
ncbi:MAG: HD domain-containing protein [Spirochaetaceae bacterium]|nr:HD domain-containing protein [Spirochaetaceae bacterium]